MRYFTGICIVLLFLAAQAVPAQAAAEKAATILKIKGKVDIQRNGKQNRATSKNGKVPLTWNDRIVVRSDKGYALVLYTTGRKVKVTEKHTVTKENSRVPDKKKKGTEKASIAFSRIGGARNPIKSPRGLYIISPFNHSLTNPRPEFLWAMPQDAGPATLTISDINDEILWSVTASTTAFAIPAAAPPLPRGEIFIMRVTAIIDGQEQEATSGFSILTQEEIDELNAAIADVQEDFAGDDPDDIVLRLTLEAELYAEYELFPEAARALRQRLDLDPEDTLGRDALVDMLFATGRFDEGRELLQNLAPEE